MSLINLHKTNINEIARTAAYEYVKEAKSKPTTSYGLAGRLFISKSGWGLLHVPNSLVRGAFDALQEPGVELPPSGANGQLRAHISVIRPEEIEQLGGVDKITERGQVFRYTLGRVKEVVPEGWDGMGKVWLIEVKSPELQNLRKSYGLTALPKNNRYEFHITIAVRRKKVLAEGEISKA